MALVLNLNITDAWLIVWEGQGDFKMLESLLEVCLAPDAIIWRAFLGACVIYKNVELAEEATVSLLELEPRVDGNYSCLTFIPKP